MVRVIFVVNLFVMVKVKGRGCIKLISVLTTVEKPTCLYAKYGNSLHGKIL